MLEVSKKSFHHKNLRGALKQAARELIVTGQEHSLRAASRMCGVSATASYRHFDDKRDLFGEVAKEDLAELEAVVRNAPGAEIAYVEWAISNRARFAHAVVAGHEHMDAFTEIFGSRWPAIHGAASLAAEGLISIEQALASVSP